jgi:hypothetical protein
LLVTLAVGGRCRVVSVETATRKGLPATNASAGEGSAGGQGNPGSEGNADTPSGIAETALALTQPPTEGAAEEKPIPAGPGRYVLGREIGRGAMGRVSEATDQQFQRVVALKQLLDPSEGGGLRARFATEAIVTGNLEHPGIPIVYERGVDEKGVPFYIMRKVSGRTLSSALREASTLEKRLKLLPALIQIAQTLAYAHERGVIHRDVKPDNVLLGHHGEAVMLDWGIAKVRGLKGGEARATVSLPASGPGTMYGSVMGTPAYMAPEQALGEVDKIDERSDVFSLGAMLYHLLAGRPPYMGKNAEEAVQRAREARPPSLAEVAAPASPELRAICERAMARSPADRYQSASEMATALESFLSQAVVGKASTAVTWFTGIGTTVGLLIALISCAFVWTLSPTLRESGKAVFPLLIVGATGCAFSLVELRTGGRHHLSPLALAFAACSLILGIALTGSNLFKVLDLVSSPGVTSDPEVFRAYLSEGMKESMGPVELISALCGVQVLLWGLARRTVLRNQSGRR